MISLPFIDYLELSEHSVERTKRTQSSLYHGKDGEKALKILFLLLVSFCIHYDSFLAERLA